MSQDKLNVRDVDSGRSSSTTDNNNNNNNDTTTTSNNSNIGSSSSSSSSEAGRHLQVQVLSEAPVFDASLSSAQHEEEVAAGLRQVLSPGSFAGLVMQLADTGNSSSRSITGSSGDSHGSKQLAVYPETVRDDGQSDKRQRQISPSTMQQRQLTHQQQRQQPHPPLMDPPSPLAAVLAPHRTVDVTPMHPKMADSSSMMMVGVASCGSESGRSNSSGGSLDFANMSLFSSADFPTVPSLVSSSSCPSSSSVEVFQGPVTSLGLVEGQPAIPPDWQDGVPLDSPSQIFISRGGDGGSSGMMVIASSSTSSSFSPMRVARAAEFSGVGGERAGMVTRTAAMTRAPAAATTDMAMMGLRVGLEGAVSGREGGRGGMYRPILDSDTHYNFAPAGSSLPCSIPPSPRPVVSPAGDATAPPAVWMGGMSGKGGGEMIAAGMAPAAHQYQHSSLPPSSSYPFPSAVSTGALFVSPVSPPQLPTTSPILFNAYYAPLPPSSSSSSSTSVTTSSFSSPSSSTTTPAARVSTAAEGPTSGGPRTRRRNSSITDGGGDGATITTAAAAAAAAAVAEAEADQTGLVRGNYRCGRCGGLKKNHVCPYLYEEDLETRDAGTEIDLMLTQGNPGKGGLPDMPSGLSFHLLTVRPRPSPLTLGATAVVAGGEGGVTRGERGMELVEFNVHCPFSSPVPTALSPLLVPLPVPPSAHLNQQQQQR